MWSVHLCKREHLFAGECIQHSVSANSAVVAIHKCHTDVTACKALTSVWCKQLIASYNVIEAHCHVVDEDKLILSRHAAESATT